MWIVSIIQLGCSDSKGQIITEDHSLPVFTAGESDAMIYREYPASLEGKENVEIRALSDGYLDKIFVEEGAYVKAGQPLFRIEAGIYNEDLNNSQAELMAATANMKKAKIEVERLTPLVASKVIAPIQLNTAKEEYEVAKASVKKAMATQKRSSIMLGYTLIKSPVDGYIGRIPFKLGSLISRNDAQPLTVVSNVQVMYAYFSLSEPDFVTFKNTYPGRTLEEKIKNLPQVDLITVGDSIYSEKGKVDLVQGQFDRTVGAITFRASFRNIGGLLRTGNTGRIRIAEKLERVLTIPRESTFELQDRSFVFVVQDSNKVTARPLRITGQTTHYYYIKDGIKSGDKLVFHGTELLNEGMRIQPQIFSLDSLVRARPE
ncbi:MAG: efflux RND transporter periplasmic adaptor subunit [Ferruginibacter sp.]